MEIFFLILKVIGIVAGVLLAACLLLFGAVLAVPVRYHVGAKVQQKKVSGNAVFSWLFHIVDVRLLYEKDEVIFRLRIFGIPVGGKNGKKRKQKKKGKKPAGTSVKSRNKKEYRKISGNSKETEEEAVESQKDTKELPEKERRKKEGQEEQERNNIGIKGKNRKDRRCTKDRTEKQTPFRRIAQFFGNLKQRISGIMAKGQTAKEKIHNIKIMISDEANRSAFVWIWRELKYLIRHYSPRKASGELAFAMKDPSQTGQVLGALSVLPFWARYKISIYPDFQAEEFFAEGWMKMKGHIRLWHLMVSAVRLIKAKDVRILLQRIRT